MLEILLSLYLNLHQLNFPNSPTAPHFAIPLSDSKPYINAKSGLIYNTQTGQILYNKNPNQKLPIASLTKLLTAHIILQEHSLDEIVTIPQEAAETEGSTMNLQAGERITVKNLLKGLLINSANDAAIALSLHNSPTTKEFTNKMNLYANNLQMYNSHFDNPMGFDSPNNYSTTNDLLKLAEITSQTPIIQEIANTQTTTVTSTEGRTKHLLKNTNKELQNFQNINGLKTGTTELAGQCLITTTDQNLITILLGSSNRFQDTKTMIDWAKSNFK